MTVLGPIPCQQCRAMVKWVRIDGRLVLMDAAGGQHRCRVVA